MAYVMSSYKDGYQSLHSCDVCGVEEWTTGHSSEPKDWLKDIHTNEEWCSLRCAQEAREKNGNPKLIPNYGQQEVPETKKCDRCKELNKDIYLDLAGRRLCPDCRKEMVMVGDLRAVKAGVERALELLQKHRDVLKDKWYFTYGYMEHSLSDATYNLGQMLNSIPPFRGE